MHAVANKLEFQVDATRQRCLMPGKIVSFFSGETFFEPAVVMLDGATGFWYVLCELRYF